MYGLGLTLGCGRKLKTIVIGDHKIANSKQRPPTTPFTPVFVFSAKSIFIVCLFSIMLGHFS